MGCASTGSSTGPRNLTPYEKALQLDTILAKRVTEEKAVQENLDSRLTAGLSRVLENLSMHLNDPEMLKEILDVCISFIGQWVEDDRIVTQLKCAFLATYMQQGLSKNISKQFCRAVGLLITPEALAKLPDPERDLFDYNWLFDELALRVDNRNQQEGQLTGKLTRKPTWLIDREAGNCWSQIGERSPLGTTQNEYFQDQVRMLEFLEPFFELLQDLPLGLCQDDGKAMEEKDRLKYTVGMAAMVVKVYDAKQKEQPRRACFVGPPSVGKSTLINYLVSGRGPKREFMPESSRTPVSFRPGTNFLCIIADGDVEQVRVGGTESETGDVAMRLKDEVDNINKGDSKLTSLDAVTAQMPFSPPIPVQLIDLPGLPGNNVAGNCLKTLLAAAISSVLVICLGSLRTASDELKKIDGALNLVAKIFEMLPDKLSILCIATKIKKEEFDEAEYVHVLRTYFKGAGRVRAIWANFHEINDEEERQQAVLHVYEVLGACLPDTVPTDPYKTFLDLRPKVDLFRRKFWEKMKPAFEKYFSSFDTAIEEMKAHMINPSFKTDLRFFEMCFQSPAIDKHIVVDIKSMPTTRGYFIRREGQLPLAAGASDRPIAQELITETRLKIVDWLLIQGDQLHERTIRRVFDYLPDVIMTAASRNDMVHRFAQEFIISKFMEVVWHKNHALSNDPSVGEMHGWSKVGGTSNMMHMLEMGNNSLLSLLDVRNFSHVVMGYYLLSVDGFTKKELLEQADISGLKAEQATWNVKWNADLLKNINLAPYEDWTKRCREKRDQPNEVTRELFQCMSEACELFAKTVEGTKMLHDWTPPLTELLEICFEVLQRLMVKHIQKQDQADPHPVFTSFAKFLHKSAELDKQVVNKTRSSKVSDLNNADDFLHSLRTEIKNKMNAIVGQIKFDHPDLSTALIYPDVDCIHELFKGGPPDADTETLSVKELPARRVLCKTMLGQIIHRASVLADIAYDKLLGPIIDYLGSHFFMDGVNFQKDLLEFVHKGKAKDGEELVWDLIQRQHFKHMYVGCALWSAVPLVHCFILPCLILPATWEPQGEKPESEQICPHRVHIERASAILQSSLEKSDDQGICQSPDSLRALSADIDTQVTPVMTFESHPGLARTYQDEAMWGTVLDLLRRARVVHLLSTPWGGDNPQADSEQASERGACRAAEVCEETTKTFEGVITVDPNKHLRPMSAGKGGTQEAYEKRCLDAWTQVMQIGQRKTGSKVYIIKHASLGLIGHAQRQEEKIAQLANMPVEYIYFD